MVRKISTHLVPLAEICLFDALVALMIFLGGLFYHWNGASWGIGMVGDSPYGDAHFWWDGALHVSEGIIADHPGRGFRPGYFLLTGLILPVLGSHFLSYIKYFLIIFLSSSILLYFSLRSPLGRLGATCAVILVVFNPFTAEWISTSTTDSTGMIIHILSIASLLLALDRNLSLGWLAGFGLLFSLGTLTRPLVTPFLGVVLLVILLIKSYPFKKRILSASCIFVAFCIPTFLWMLFQKASCNEWSISTNDASAFYAASDPHVQVWNPSMYVAIRDSAVRRHGDNNVTPALINEECWRLTIQNYGKYWTHHIQRFFPHLWKIACFTPKRAAHPAHIFYPYPLAILAVGLSLIQFYRGCWLRGILLLIPGTLLLTSASAPPYLVVAGASLAIISWRGSARNPVIFLLACYWLTGVLTLFLTGGTWGPPLGAAIDLNALGYRLGCQVFFAGDVLACCFLIMLATGKTEAVQVPQFVSSRLVQYAIAAERYLLFPRPWAAKIVFSLTFLLLLTTAATYALGSVIVAKRFYERTVTPHRPYPDLAPVIELCRQRSPRTPPVLCSDYAALQHALSSNLDVKGGDILTTGSTSHFVWNLAGQERAQVLTHYQDIAFPVTRGTRWLILEYPRQLVYKDWTSKQGAFILRNFSDKHNKSNLPYYLSVPAVRAYIPLAGDRQKFLLDKAVWFPLNKYATQLDTSGDLLVQNGVVEWRVDSGTYPHKRRFLLKRSTENDLSKPVVLAVNLKNAIGNKKLSFQYQLESAPARRGDSHVEEVNYCLLRISTNKESAVKEWTMTGGESTFDVKPSRNLRPVNFEMNDAGMTSVAIAVDLPKNVGLSFYEFILQADDFSPCPKLEESVSN